MPTVEIDETELLRLRQLNGVAAKIMADPKGRRLLEQAHKVVDANAPTPTLDQDAAANEPAKKLSDELDTLKKQLADEKAEREKAEKLAGIAALQEKGKLALREQGWTEEGIKGVEKIMEDKGILDPLDASAIFEKLHPQPAPAAPSGHGAWGFMDNVQDGEKDLKALIDSKGENNGLIDKMAREALAEVRGQTTRR